MKKFSGVMPALMTPVTNDGKLDEPALTSFIEYLILQGADGFYVAGATGEGLILDFDTHAALTESVCKTVAGRVPVIVHTARMNFSEAVFLAKHAEKCGADAISAVPPLFYSYGEDELFNYYKKLSESTALPFIIYNNPGAGVTFTDSLLDRLFSLKSITGIKWTNSDYAAVLRLKSRKNDVNIINGPDQTLLLGLCAGCDGGIGTTYNFLLPLVKEVFRLFPDISSARLVQEKVSRIISALDGFSLLSATRFIISRLGFHGFENTVFPAKPLSESEKTLLLKRLKDSGFEV